MSKIFESKFGSEYKQLFKDGPSDAQDASNATRFLYLTLVLVDVVSNEFDQIFLELNQKVLFQYLHSVHTL